MPVFECYHDASGSARDSDKALVIAGVLSTKQKWLRLDAEWHAVLSDFDLPYLHMKEFAHSRGPFSHLKGREIDRGQLLQRLILALKRRAHKGFQLRIVPAVFEKLNSEYELEEHWGNAYALLAALNIMEVNKYLGPFADVDHIVERGDFGQARLLSISKTYLNPSPAIRDKVDPATGKHHFAFQAADLLAYETRTNVQRHLEGLPQTARQSLLAITTHFPVFRGYVDEEVLRGACELDPEAFPRRKAG